MRHGDDSGARVGSKRSGSPRSSPVAAAVARPLVEGVEEAVELQIRQREHVPEPTGEERPAVAGRRDSAHQLDPDRGEGIQVERRVRRADELRRGQAPGAGQIVDRVVPLVPHARAVHPPEHVASAVPAREADVLTDGERHRPPRAVNLVGELDTGRRGADDEHAPVGQLGRIAIVERGDLLDVRRQRRAHRRHARRVVAAAREHDGPAADLAVARHDPIAVVGARHRGDGRVRADRRARHRRVPRDEVDHLGHRHVAVRIGAVVVMAGQPALPVGRQQPQRVPALVAPGVRHLPALEEDVIDRTLGQEPARREAGVTGPDDDRRELLYVLTTSTVTFTGFVRAS